MECPNCGAATTTSRTCAACGHTRPLFNAPDVAVVIIGVLVVAVLILIVRAVYS